MSIAKNNQENQNPPIYKGKNGITLKCQEWCEVGNDYEIEKWIVGN
jgi:hypothetical protein